MIEQIGVDNAITKKTKPKNEKLEAKNKNLEPDLEEAEGLLTENSEEEINQEQENEQKTLEELEKVRKEIQNETGIDANEEEKLKKFKEEYKSRRADMWDKTPSFIQEFNAPEVKTLQNATKHIYTEDDLQGDSNKIKERRKYKGTLNGFDKYGNNFDFFVTKQDAWKLRSVKDINGEFVPTNEKMRKNLIFDSLSEDKYYRLILNKALKASEVVEVIKSADLPVPSKIEELYETELSSKNEVKGSTGFQNTFYPIQNDLKFLQSRDVSYKFDGLFFPRTTNELVDQDGSHWMQIFKEPETQACISLLSQQFFNVSPVVKSEIKTNRAMELVSTILGTKIEKKLHSYLKKFDKKNEIYVSKVLSPEEIQRKSANERHADYITFGTIFDGSPLDRDYKRSHNIHYWDSLGDKNDPNNDKKGTYRLFDFDKSNLTPLSRLKEGDTRDGNYKYNNKWFFHHIRGLDGEAGWDSKERSLDPEVISNVTKKLEEMVKFFNNEDGKNFFNSVIDKTGYVDYKKSDKEDLYLGFIERMKILSECLLEEVEERKKPYIGYLAYKIYREIDWKAYDEDIEKWLEIPENYQKVENQYNEMVQKINDVSTLLKTPEETKK